ncbi:MAG: glycosyltransferase [Nocardioidaceae bacterium]|nr:glycosyltransferase [Nocardioidaceae bacterium]MCL2613697.1 glycosyltransferase [Nocardioidaceae bacterium]
MLHIVIPAYNEQVRLPRTLRALRRYVAAHRATLGRVEVTIVDNASDDATSDVAAAWDSPGMPVRVVGCPVRGKGAAVRTGLLAVTDAGIAAEDLVCFMDADGATDLEALEAAWSRVQRGADVVIGSRGLSESDAETRHDRARTTGAALYRHLARRLVPGISDTQCGFKLFRAGVVRAAAEQLATRGFSFDVELLVRLSRAGACIVEIPVRWADVPGSTFVPLRHGARSFLDLAAIAWRTRATEASVVLIPGRVASRPSRQRSPMPLLPSVALPAALPALAAVMAPLASPAPAIAQDES